MSEINYYKPSDVIEQNWGPDGVREYLEQKYGNKLKHVESQPVLPSLGDELRRVHAKRKAQQGVSNEQIIGRSRN